MVKRIKKYKIAVRPSQVLRLLKKKSVPGTDFLSVQEPESDLEKKIEAEIAVAQKSIVPSSAYETYSQNEIPELLKGLWNFAPPGSVSLSLIATTIGASLETEMKQFQNSNDPKSSLLEAIGTDAIDQSFNFAAKLIQEEAKQEGCEAMPPQTIDSQYLKEALASLQIPESEMCLSADSRLTPLYSRVGILFWNPLKKR